jgi:hypothetical protein
LKVKIINEQGVEVSVNPDNITVGTLTLKQFLDRFVKLENEVTKKFKALEQREQTLKQAVKKL